MAIVNASALGYTIISLAIVNYFKSLVKTHKIKRDLVRQMNRSLDEGDDI